MRAPMLQRAPGPLSTDVLNATSDEVPIAGAENDAPAVEVLEPMAPPAAVAATVGRHSALA